MLFCDLILLPLALWSAVVLRVGSFGYDVWPFAVLFVAVPVLTIPIFIKIGLYRAVIRFLDDKVIYTILLGVSLSVLCMVILIGLGGFNTLPRSSIFIYWFIAVTYISTSRYLARGIIRKIEVTQKGRKEAVAIYGAGQIGLQTALTLQAGRKYNPVAFFDENPQLHGSVVAGLTVYPPEQATEVLLSNDCKQVLLAIPRATRIKKNEIIRKFDGLNVTLKTIPALNELIDGDIRIEDIREVGIEDLLGRDPVPPIDELISGCVTRKNVLVTGAGGSIGSELCRQIVKLNPKKIILFEVNEFNLYKLEQELNKNKNTLEIVSVLGDVLNEKLLDQIVRTHQINTIYHAAAFKHVPLVEANIASAVVNNVFGTLNVARTAMKYKINHLVLISTDKAVRPTNVMGATKRLAELTLQAFAHKSTESQSLTKFSMVRFGNVLGSSGSVVPLFKEQIKQGGPVTVTHPEVTRFFMTIPEAAQLVLQAGSLTVNGDVFVLDMGESVKIVDLARKMIELSGLSVFDSNTGLGDITIKFIGLRPGEKLYEELLIGNNSEWTTHPRIMRAKENYLDFDYLSEQLNHLYALVTSDISEDMGSKIKQHLKVLVPDYAEESSV